MKVSLNNQLKAMTFNAKPKAPVKEYGVKAIPFKESDIVPGIGRCLPECFEYSETELKAKELMENIEKLERELHVRKRDLRDYYLPQDKAEYQDLMRVKRNMDSQFRRCAKKVQMDQYSLWSLLSKKKEYNFYSKRIFKAESVEVLNRLKQKLDNGIMSFVKKMLFELIEHRKTILK